MCSATLTARPNRTQLNQGQNWITPSKRLAIYMRDSFGCVYCRRGVESEGVVLTLDHLIPYSAGGALLDPTNLVTACRNCNSKRQAQGVEAFVKAHASTWRRRASKVLACIEQQRHQPLDSRTSGALIRQRGSCRKVLDVVAQGDPI